MSDIEPRQAPPAEEREAQAQDPEVLPQAERRQFTAEYKLHILEEADRSPTARYATPTRPCPPTGA